MSSTKTVLVGLNEINFDFVKGYTKQGKLPTFKRLIDQFDLIETQSEDEHQLIEPWIQWVSIHTGKSYSEHRVFRLGDIVENTHLTQIWETLEMQGKTVGAISPFNAANRLKKPKFFVPDPWTKTNSSGGKLIDALSTVVQHAVSNNTDDRLTIKSLCTLLAVVFRYAPLKRWPVYVLLARSIKRPGTRALILDTLLSDVFLSLYKSRKPDFSSIFLNAGAHIQHHYMFNSGVYTGSMTNPEWYCPKDVDPLLQVLEAYDSFLERLLNQNARLIIATGLHQVPHEKNTYYWRLKDHAHVLNLLGIDNFTEIIPRMSRDFLIVFTSEQDALVAEIILDNIRSLEDEIKAFSIDNRGKSLFVEFIYDCDISDDNALIDLDRELKIPKLRKHVLFAAIKNGEHHSTGYLLTNIEQSYVKGTRMPIESIHDFIVHVTNNPTQ